MNYINNTFWSELYFRPRNYLHGPEYKSLVDRLVLTVVSGTRNLMCMPKITVQ